jgi:protein-S-isoprenylcysteine O-methyltransferase Ste14
MASTTDERSGLPFPPPLIYLASLLAGIALDKLLPPLPLVGGWGAVPGWVCLLGGALIMPFVLLRFRRARTPFVPLKASSALITGGPYRLSRHPSYSALTLLYLGLGFLLHNCWILLLTVPTVLAMDRWVMRREEAQLEMMFGERYRSYQARVRRWM